MAKKKKSKKINSKVLKQVLLIAAVALGLSTFVFMFINGIKYGTDDPIFYSCSKVIFGYTKVTEIGSSAISTPIFKFSFLNLVPYILVIGGVVVAILSSSKKNNNLLFLAAGLFIGAAVMFAFPINFAQVAYEEVLNSKVYVLDKESMSLGVGYILNIIASALAGSCAVARVVIK